MSTTMDKHSPISDENLRAITRSMTGAVIDNSAQRRYLLWRRWDWGAQNVNFVMLNPSTADETVDDPTIRRCCGFAKDWGYGGVVVTNLFAWRATKPADVVAACNAGIDVTGDLNDLCIPIIADACGAIVCAWGAKPWARERAEQVVKLLRKPNRTLWCLGLTRDGSPRHPLYVTATSPLYPLYRR